MEKKHKYALIAAAAIGTLSLGALLLFSGKSESNTITQEDAPQNTLVEFTQAMKAGDFDKALSLCDTTEMQEYLEDYQQKWQTLSLKDSAAFASTLKILEQTTMTVNKVEKNDEGVCLIDYTLEMKGQTKSGHACLAKEEGEWKVVKITSAI
jgi:hypothetical protein